MNQRAAKPTVNLLENLPPPADAEYIDELAAAEGVRLERIISNGHASPPGFWYDQSEAEWVFVIAGKARLQIEDEVAERQLGPGDSLYLPPHCRHRVTWTDADRPTVWLALFIDADKDPKPRGTRQ